MKLKLDQQTQLKAAFFSYCEASEVYLEPISSALPREETVAAVLEQ